MNRVLTVILGIHCHIANGEGHFVFERAYKERIRPVLSSLYKFPKIPAVLHFSGSFWYWIERNHGEILMLISDMISRKQIELLGGGFYEPMMPFISYNDRIGHIEMLTTYLRKHFGKRAQGCLLPEFTWEVSMPSVLASCNIAYTFINESYLLEAGLNEKDLYKPFISEDKGKLIIIFPVLKNIAGEFEKNVSGTIDRLLEGASGGKNMITSIFPPCFNGENPGEITETSAFSFLSELSACENRIDFALPSKMIKSLPPLQKIYFPHKAVKQILIKHPETNNLYAKMVFIRSLIDQLRGDKIRKRHAYEELWKAQDYNLYCGGEEKTSGVSIRKAAYQALLEAEKITRCHNSNFTPSLMAFDFNFDGINEYLFHGDDINCFISETGAGIFELDYIPSPWNYGVMAGMNGKRCMFRDTIAPADFPPERIISGDDAGLRICGGERYGMTAIDRQRCKVSFKLPAGPEASDSGFSGVEIEKTYSLRKNEFNVAYSLTNKSGKYQSFTFMTELNMSFSNDDESNLRIYSYAEYRSFQEYSGKTSAPAFKYGASSLNAGKGINVSDTAAIDFQDIHNEVIINLSADTSFNALIFSERGKVVSEAGGPETPADFYESSRIVISKNFHLAPDAAVNIKFCLSFYH
jgi:hypothetical protein